MASAMLFFAVRPGWKLRQRALKWPTTQGRILESGTRKPPKGVPKGGDLSRQVYARYAYTVDGTDYEAERIAPLPLVFYFQANARIEACRWPERSVVDVRYDPDDPGEALLQTHLDINADHVNGMLILIVQIMLAIGLWIVVGMPGKEDLFWGVFGLMLFGFAMSGVRRRWGADKWPKTTATVTRTDILERERSALSSDDVNQSWTAYIPVVAYEFSVDRVPYEADNTAFGAPEFKSRKAAEAVVARAAIGSSRTIRYNPAVPDITAPENPRKPWPLMAVAAFGAVLTVAGPLKFFLT